jgi:hypothetical protein
MIGIGTWCRPKALSGKQRRLVSKDDGVLTGTQGSASVHIMSHFPLYLPSFGFGSLVDFPPIFELYGTLSVA